MRPRLESPELLGATHLPSIRFVVPGPSVSRQIPSVRALRRSGELTAWGRVQVRLFLSVLEHTGNIGASMIAGIMVPCVP